MIYHLLDEAEPFSESQGGAISRWAANVLRNSSEVVVCPSHDDSWGFPKERVYRLPRWEHTRYPVHAVLYRLPWSAQKMAYLRVFREFLAGLQRGDVLYIHNRPECAGPIATVAKEHGIHVVLHMHNSLLMEANRGQMRSLRHTPIVFCSDFLRQEVETAFPGHFKKTYLVHNGADEGHFQAEHKAEVECPTIIYTGRIVPYKGVHILVEAMRLLQLRGVNAHCKIVGGVGFGTSKRSRYVKNLMRNPPPNVEFTGYMSGKNFAALLRSSDIFCAPSIWHDPFPLAPLEAMACGLPVVASRVGGIPEALCHGGGVLVPPADPVQLADALQPLLQDFQKRQSLGKQALKVFQDHFAWSHVRERYQSVVQDVLS